MALKSSYQESFEQELKKLNPAQMEAVTHIEGPVLVIAGPGTGKTQILSARIGKILSSPETQASPDNILCLTYTDAGTIAMRKRLLKFIGPDAYRVHIYTFHAFCNQVIQDNLDYFGIRELQPVSELELVQVYQSLIDSFPPDHPLKRYSGEVYFEVDRLKILFDLMKREGWSPEFISRKIDEYLESLPDRDGFTYKRANASKGIKAGDLNQRLFDLEKDKVELLRAAAFEYPNYVQRMREIRRYDYNDMILWVLKAFSENNDLLLQYQEKYLYFLVDEYQDTNGAQNEILNLLTSYWDKPNVFVVGDDDQSIYRFQGANVKNILDFHHRFAEEVKVIVMSENYRSTQHILDLSKSIIENNEERLVNKIQGLDKNLQSKNPELINSQVFPRIIEYYNTLHEEAGIVKEIEKLYNAGEDLSEVAVIYRNHRIVENIVKTLERKNIPLNIRQKVNILDLPFIQSLIKLLTYIQEEYDKPDSAEYLLYEIMHYPFFKVSVRDVAVIVKACNVVEEGRKRSIRELIGSRERMFQLHLESARAISELEGNLTYWIKELPNLTLQVLFEKIITKGGILSYVMTSPDKVWLMQVLTTFFDFIKDESAKRSSLTLREFLEMISQMQKNNIPMFLNKVVHNEKGVNFVTAHSSKGLEYKHVFLIAAAAKYWEKQAGRSRTYKIPDTLTEVDTEDKTEEERRLFYVGVTRAKEQLFITYAARENSDKEQEMSRFVAEVLEKMPLVVERVSLSEEEIIEFQAGIMMDSAAPEIELINEEYIKDVIKNYKMSVTHLNKFLRCPLSFYFENIIKVPTARSESMGFGNAIHYALHQLFLTMTRSADKTFPDKETFYTYFLRGMNNHHSHFTEKEFERRLEYAGKLLPEYYDHYVNTWNKTVLTEYRVVNTEVEGVPITGALDKIEFDNNSVNVVDYKTGKPENGKKKLNPPSEKDPNGGDYWRQIVFYKILLDSDKRKKYTMVSGEIDFVEKGNNKEFTKVKVYVKPEDIDLVKQQIKDTYNKIMNLEFNKGCGEEDCQWCNFVKYNYKSDHLSLQEKEDDKELID
ncbi:MAG TPA: ATP-dependent DNA helicase [Cytophagaceae bacterium]